MIVSTFPGFSEQEALRDLSPTDSDNNARHTMLRTPDGRLAGWISAEPSSHHSLSLMEGPDASENDSTDGLSSPASCAPLGLRDNDYLKKTRTEGTAFFDTCVKESIMNSSTGELKASRRVRRGDVVAVERPLVALQTSEAMPWVVACPGCIRHVGSLDVQLALATGSVDRTNAFDSGSWKTDVLPSEASVRRHQSNGVMELTDSSDEKPDNELEEVPEEGLPSIAGLSTRFDQVSSTTGLFFTLAGCDDRGRSCGTSYESLSVLTLQAHATLSCYGRSSTVLRIHEWCMSSTYYSSSRLGLLVTPQAA